MVSLLMKHRRAKMVTAGVAVSHYTLFMLIVSLFGTPLFNWFNTSDPSYNTLTYELELVCDQASFTILLQQIWFVGLLLGAILIGTISGERSCLF